MPAGRRAGALAFAGAAVFSGAPAFADAPDDAGDSSATAALSAVGASDAPPCTAAAERRRGVEAAAALALAWESSDGTRAA
ncbi:hypothetical protein PZH32_02935 [Adlercreutzia equolifaciens]|uniref:hypothetical protein n=1 Tax=Adlercreutzia equolifaciens TaxID=446660 RepID=UPI0023B15316|nr:hypothetical protein [Adlercreutzia equolifaciens]MDE8701912.1 hypothetical protein [Adlercreutzia equolifaciens]